MIIRLYGHVAGRLPRPLVSRLYSSPAIAGAIRRGMNAVLPTEPREVEVMAGPLKGARVPIYPRNELSFISGLWEFWVQDALLEHVRPGDRVWDVGAYIGYFSLIMRLRAGHGRVYALEPDPMNRERLERMLRANGATDIQVLPCAAGSYNGEIGLIRQDGHPATSATDGAGELSVPVTTLDTLAERLGDPRLIKLDVEGAEAEILRAAPRLVHEVRPIWLLELHGADGQDAVRLLSAAGYRIDHLNRAESATHQEHILATPSGAHAGESSGASATLE
jgi:FkbM family methyltransferase